MVAVLEYVCTALIYLTPNCSDVFILHSTGRPAAAAAAAAAATATAATAAGWCPNLDHSGE